MRDEMTHLLRLGLIADDLTGALDTGVQFAQKGLLTVVSFKFSASLEPVPVLAVNSKTRHSSPESAHEKVRRICKKLRGRTLYKKVDSTLRGNVGPEILAVLSETGLPKAVLAPAFPTQGRTIEGGILKFGGVPIHLTHYREEFVPPLTTSSISDILRRDTGERIGHVTENDLRRGPSYLAGRVLEGKERIVLIDTLDSEDLRCVAETWWTSLRDKVLICGSAGLAMEIEMGGDPPENRMPRRTSARLPILLLSGSRHPKTVEQLRKAVDRFRFPLIEPDLREFVHPERASREVRRVTRSVSRALVDEPGVVFSTSFLDAAPGHERIIAKNLGKAVAGVLRHHRLSSLILSGGDIAAEACSHLRTTAMRIDDEIVQGAPLSSLTDGPYKGLRIVTKGGGLGDADAFIKVIKYLNHSE
jgi:D-threonate/D-erythronate kinase